MVIIIPIFSKARFPSKRNRLRCVRAWLRSLRALRLDGNLLYPIGCKQQPIGYNRSKQWQPWLAACQRKRLRLARFLSKRNARNASDCVWMETGLTSHHEYKTLRLPVGSAGRSVCCIMPCSNARLRFPKNSKSRISRKSLYYVN